MATQQKKSNKKLARSGRMAARNKGTRTEKILHARRVHLKNARQSCGLVFSVALASYYARVGLDAPKKAGRNKK